MNKDGVRKCTCQIVLPCQLLRTHKNLNLVTRSEAFNVTAFRRITRWRNGSHTRKGLGLLVPWCEHRHASLVLKTGIRCTRKRCFKIWESGSAMSVFFHNFSDACRWRCFSYEKRCHLVIISRLPSLSFQAFVNSHLKISILALSRLKVLL